ncbi:hypothetical protein BJX61DRAFT_268514 [Aspergillus egyptiacus]|nr:hypothetical protein BJX61DRAFT_268514 [Aspergillus egyptiacus]
MNSLFRFHYQLKGVFSSFFFFFIRMTSSLRPAYIQGPNTRGPKLAEHQSLFPFAFPAGINSTFETVKTTNITQLNTKS